jgi:Family of unknown function (DUF6228)
VIEWVDGWLEARGHGGNRVRFGEPAESHGSFPMQLLGDGFRAETMVVEFWHGGGLVAWFAELAAAFRGWQGTRTWASLEGDALLEVTHDGLGEVALRVTLRRDTGDPPVWTVSAVVPLEAGEELTRLAEEVARLFGPG